MRRAFTLLELVVVMILLGITAGLIAPRLGSLAPRRAEAAARDARTLLSVLGHRDSVPGPALALRFDAASSTLAVDRLDPQAKDWRPDPLVPPASTAGLRLTQALADGVPLDTASFRLELPRHTPRPTLELTFESDGTPATTHRILWHSSSAEAQLAAQASLDPFPSPIDLDAAGLGEVAW